MSFYYSVLHDYLYDYFLFPASVIAATCARQQNENNQDTKQSNQKTQSVGGSYGRRGGSGHE